LRGCYFSRLDWTRKYPAIAAAVSSLGARQAYLNGELCGVFPDGITSFSMIQAASDAGNAAGLVFFLFNLLHLDGDDIGARPLIERKERLAQLLSGIAPPLRITTTITPATARLSMQGPANCRLKAPSRNAPTRPATAACGAR
jgi:ATP-dependent DNA ligase